MNTLCAALGLLCHLCVNGHPAHRAPTTYAGLPPIPGYQRDHRIPRCLGGADSRENVWYQPLPEAHRKDALERQACEAYCRGALSLDQARDLIRKEFP